MAEAKPDDAAAAEPLPFVAPCRTLAPLAALGWLRRGWQDLRAAPLLSLSYGLFTAVVSLAMSLVAIRFGAYWLLLAALSGFVFIGPVFCLGLYAISAQLERGQQPSQRVSLREAGVSRLGTEMVFALMLLVVFLVWARAGSMVHVFFPMDAQPEFSDLVTYLGIGSAVGSVFAAITFAASAFALPMIMHRDVDAVTAVVTSINAVLRNKLAMAVWAGIIVTGVALGFLTGFVGLVVTIPLLGHATWHGYLETIDASAFPRHQEGVAAAPRPR
ncbi:MAG: DUF2189 domain-containing protein [Gammaproteobacteria bacterium]